MKERFLGFKKTVRERLDEFLKCALDKPPSYEAAAAGFVHSKNCSQSIPLRKIEIETPVSFRDGGVWGMSVTNIMIIQKYLECGECKASVRYLG